MVSANATQMVAELHITGGDFSVRVLSEDTGKMIAEFHADEPGWAGFMEIIGLGQYASLLQMEHDLNSDCCCETCYAAEEIRRAHS